MTLRLRATAGATAVAAVAALLTITPAEARPAPTPVPKGTERLSLTADGAQADGDSGGAALSADGRTTAFWSHAPNMGGDYFNALLVKDLRTGALTRVPGTRGAGGIALSADGNLVGYSSGSRYPNPYVYDRTTGTTIHLVPTNPPGGSEFSGLDDISADGRYASYTATDRHPSSPRVLYVRELSTGTDTMVTPPDATDRYTYTSGGSLSGNGRKVLFKVTRKDDPAPSHAYVRDLGDGSVRQLDVKPDGTPSADGAVPVQLSADGRHAAFTSSATDLVPGGTGAEQHSYVRDLRTGTTRLVGEAGDTALALSPDGRKLLVRRGSGLHLIDARNGRSRYVAPAGSTATDGALDRHGKAAVFASSAADLVPDDTNNAQDVFLRRW
ncbi:hypothetical protein [Streptomyces sp. ODS28]|uniref:hypothetical protein n=1 Tax=Streptomyces sp. ODS28 TaxID=3136688 RepID=UPI0031ED06A6